MYKSYEFIFADMPSSMYGLMIYDIGNKQHSDVSFGNKASILESRIRGRIRPLHYGVDYNSAPLSFNLIFGAKQELDRWQLQEVAHWLTGYQQYQWMSIEQPDLSHVQFRCLITQLTPISVGWAPHAFEAQVQCDCPYAYGYPFSETITFSDGDQYLLYNDGTAREPCKPLLEIVMKPGCTSLAITNNVDKDGLFELAGIPADGATVIVDNENGIIQCTPSRYDLYDGFNDHFLRLYPGENLLTFRGSGTVTISGRYLYNVGA